MKSDVSLYLEGGAVLRCDGKRDEFTTNFHKASQNRDGSFFITTATDSKNIKVFGRGTIDGNGKQLIKQMNLINHVMVPMNTSNFMMDGIVLRASGCGAR